MKKLLKRLGGEKMKRKTKAIKYAVWFFSLTAIFFCFFATSPVKAAVLFEDNFDENQASTWSPIIAGAPDVLNYYTTLDGKTVLRMTSIMSDGENRGIINTNTFNFSEGQIIVDFRTMPRIDNDIDIDPVNKENIDGLLRFLLYSGETGPNLAFSIFAGNFGENRTAQITGNNISESNIWDYGQDYQIVVTSVGDSTEVSFRDAVDNVLFDHTFDFNLGELGDFNIMLMQFMGKPHGQYYSDVALDYLRVYEFPHNLSCMGFGPTMDNGPVKVKKNRVLPLKAQLFDAEGFPVTDADLASPPVIQVSYDSGIEGDDPVDVTGDALPAGQGTEGNQFVFTEEGKWQYNLKTNNYSAAGTYKIFMDTGDDSDYVIDDPQCEASFVIK